MWAARRPGTSRGKPVFAFSRLDETPIFSLESIESHQMLCPAQNSWFFGVGQNRAVPAAATERGVPAFRGAVAKWLRQRIANPSFAGSNPARASFDSGFCRSRFRFGVRGAGIHRALPDPPQNRQSTALRPLQVGHLVRKLCLPFLTTVPSREDATIRL